LDSFCEMFMPDDPMRIALAQTHWHGNRPATQATYRELIAAAAAQGAQLVCLPEFTLSPYFAHTTDPSGYQWAEPLTSGATAQFFGALATQHQCYIVSSIFEQDTDGRYYDTALLHAPNGTLAGFTRKMHIPSGIGYHEDHFFSGAAHYPIHHVGWLRLALPTCYDQWFPELARSYALRGANCIYYPTAIGSEPTNPTVDSCNAWQTVQRGHAIANGLYIAAANRTGREGVVQFYGSSFICDPAGTILAQASRDQTEIITATLDLAQLQEWRRLFPLLHQRQPQHYLSHTPFTP
jgi:N-carbamoylputrescine amidase